MDTISLSRWSQIAASLPGRTDNEIKNYWNTCIKKNKKLKHLSADFSTKSNIISQSDRNCNINSASTHLARDTFRIFHSAEPFLDAMPEMFYSQPTIKTMDLGSSSVEKQCSSVDPDQNQFSIGPDSSNNQLISDSPMWIDSNSTQTLHEIGDSLKEKLKINGEMISHENENEILTNYSVITSCSTNSYSNASDFTDVSLSACSTQAAGITFLEDQNYESLPEKSSHQSWPGHNSCSQFNKPSFIWAAGFDQFCKVQAEADRDGYKDPLNSRCGEVNLGVPLNVNLRRQKSDQLSQIGGGDQWNITQSLTRDGSGMLEFECEDSADQLTFWPQEPYVQSPY